MTAERADIRAVLLDVDDTLFDRSAAQGEILRIILRELGEVFAGIPEAEAAEAFEASDRLTFQDIAPDEPLDGLRLQRSRLFLRLLGADERHAEAVTAMYVTRYPALDCPVPGAKAVVEALAASYSLGAVSNGLPDVQYTKLDALGIRDRFGCIVLSEELGVRKPDAAIFHHAAARLGVEPARCLHVGDLYEDDVVGAKRAGLRACWFNRGNLPCGDVQPDFAIQSLDELLELLACAGP